jgi:hypothetical protein
MAESEKRGMLPDKSSAGVKAGGGAPIPGKKM